LSQVRLAEEKTLERHFGEIIATAAAEREAAKIDALWKRAEGGSARAMIAVQRGMARAERNERRAKEQS
jgi:hypothetical protein